MLKVILIETQVILNQVVLSRAVLLQSRGDLLIGMRSSSSLGLSFGWNGILNLIREVMLQKWRHSGTILLWFGVGFVWGWCCVV